MRHGVEMRLDLLHQPFRLELMHDQLARGEAEHAVEFEDGRFQLSARLDALGEIGIRIEEQLPFRAQHIDHRQPVPSAHLEIVEVVRGRDLHRARALLRV